MSQPEQSARMRGLDVARAVAILGMILVNFRAMSAPDDTGPMILELGIDRIEGKAAALFVVLAGVGVTLRVNAALAKGKTLAQERRDLLRRALVLFAFGLVDLHLWEWDILHYYGLYLALAAVAVDGSSRGLLLLAAGVIAASTGFSMWLPYDGEADFWTVGESLAELTFNGLFPIFPWFSFFLFGMVLGRVDLRSPVLRRRIMLASLAVTLGLELLSECSPMPAEAAFAPPGSFFYQSLLIAWPRPPSPAFVLCAAAAATFVITFCLSITPQYQKTRLFDALASTGQLALTLYVGHAVAILIADVHGWFAPDQLLWVIGYALAFYAVGIFGASWWRARYPRGPLELLLRQLAEPSTPSHPADR